jgi:hypothetical protein
MNTSTNNPAFKERQAIKYLGRYKPNCTYSIGNSLIILPAGSEMTEYGCGGSSSQIRNNISYLTTESEAQPIELTKKYREWLTFDAFIFNDDSPIRAFDAQKTGQLQTVPRGIPETPSGNDYCQQDYDNIAGAMFMSPDCPAIRYSEIYQRYLTLPTNTKELIEWFVSFPTYLSRTYCQPDTFFNPNYWRILHAIILIEKIIGSPNSCPDSPTSCACGSALYPHHVVSRRNWLRQYITSRIGDNEVARDYVCTIETGYQVRNGMAHSPQFDRSTHEAPIDQPEIYDINRAAEAFKNDSAALMLLVTSLGDVARNLLLNSAFGINVFTPLRKLTSFPVR